MSGKKLLAWFLSSMLLITECSASSSEPEIIMPDKTVKSAVSDNDQKDNSEVKDSVGSTGETSTEKIRSVSSMTKKINVLKQNMTSTISDFSEEAESNASATEETSVMTTQLADEFAKVSQLAAQLQQLAAQMNENISFFH